MDPETVAFLLLHEAEPPELIREMAARGPRQITVVEMEKRVGSEIGPSTRWATMGWLERAGVEVLTRSEAARLEAGGVVVRRGDDERLVPADTVILALGARPQNDLAAALEGRVPELLVIGDARQVRRALDATGEGYAAACEL